MTETERTKGFYRVILSVVVPRVQKAQWEGLEKELKGIEWELVPANSPQTALELISGTFVVFMEEDSSFEPNGLREALNAFTSNPSYRKLAMVSPSVDFDNMNGRVGFSYDNHLDWDFIGDSEEGNSPTSVGYFYGSIIRVTSLKKIANQISFKKDDLNVSLQLADAFWSTGQRVEICADHTYFAPVQRKLLLDDDNFKDYRIKSNSESLKIWKREFIL